MLNGCELKKRVVFAAIKRTKLVALTKKFKTGRRRVGVSC